MFLLKRSTGHRFSVQSMIHPKPIWSFHSVENWFHSFFISNYVCVFNQSKISNMNLPWENWHANTQIAEGSTSHDDASIVKQLALSVFGKNSLRPFNIPYAFSVTTLAPHNLLLKYFCCLSVIFSLYDSMSQKNHEHQQQHSRIVYCS